jgi:hypothetical protein
MQIKIIKIIPDLQILLKSQRARMPLCCSIPTATRNGETMLAHLNLHNRHLIAENVQRGKFHGEKRNKLILWVYLLIGVLND